MAGGFRDGGHGRGFAGGFHDRDGRGFHDRDRTPTTIRIPTTAVATWFNDGCTPRMAGDGNLFESAVDGRS
jgi:hypothetical protein